MGGVLQIVEVNFYKAAADGTVSVLLGRGDGTFTAKGPYSVGEKPRSIVAGDFDGDGKLDLAVADLGAGDLEVLAGKGDGTFAPPVPFPVGGHGLCGK